MINENILNKGMTAAVLGLLTWNIMTTQDLTVKVAVLTEKIERLEERFDE